MVGWSLIPLSEQEPVDLILEDIDGPLFLLTFDEQVCAFLLRELLLFMILPPIAQLLALSLKALNLCKLLGSFLFPLTLQLIKELGKCEDIPLATQLENIFDFLKYLSQSLVFLEH